MRIRVRSWILVALTGLLVCFASAASASAETPEIEKFFAANCKTTAKDCGHELTTETDLFGHKYSVTTEPSKAEAEAEGFVQAGGRVPFGVTDFKLRTTGELPNEVPTQTVKHIRTDVAPGLATNPEAVPKCTMADFGKEELPGTGLFSAPACSGESQVGLQQATVYVAGLPVKKDVALEGPVFNLVQSEGLASLFGVALPLPKPITEGELKAAFEAHPLPGEEPVKKATEEFLIKKQYYAHTLIEGNVEWGQESKGTGAGDYHDYFEIEVSPALPLISSRLVFFGTAGEGDFITNATSCPGHLTTTLRVTDLENAIVSRPYTPPLGLSGCEFVPFEPGFALTQSTSAPDAPDEITTEASLPHDPTGTDDSQVKTATIVLPEGMTLNTAAAAGLEACTPAQARIHSEVFGTSCPAGSHVASVSLDVPGLPNGSLTGDVFLGGPESGPITGPPYTIYIVANSTRYGVSVRLKADVIPNEATGQLTTVIAEPPEQPFSHLTLHFDRGNLTAIANPLECGGGPTGSAKFEPYARPGTIKEVGFGPAVTGCASPIPFALSQTTESDHPNAGGHTSYALNLSRPEANQYVRRVVTTLPAGLVGAIPAVTLCGEPQAAQGTCSDASRIGTARITAGAGPSPYPFSGPVYLTGPYNGAPFGLSIAVPAVAGPFDLGTVVTRAKVSIDKTTARVTSDALVPTIVKGVPIRLRTVRVEINRSNFLFNPTSCSPGATETSLTSTTGTVQATLSSPFSVANCTALAFKPKFGAASNARTSRVNGAYLETTLSLPAGGANVKSVRVQLPPQLPSRLSTLQKACPEATFAVDPFRCPSGSFVGGVRANTPTLRAKVKGPAILVSHGGAAFPDLDLVLQGEGVTVILIGNTDIKKGITTTTFAATPDVPVSSITVNLPRGTHSALTNFGDLCLNPLSMPTTITAQNGKVVKTVARIRVKNCGVKIVGKKVIGNTAYISVRTFGAGRITGSGSGLATRSRRFHGAGQRAALLKLPLTAGARSRHRPFRVRVHVRFHSTSRTAKSSKTSTTVRF